MEDIPSFTTSSNLLTMKSLAVNHLGIFFEQEALSNFLPDGVKYAEDTGT